MELRANNLSKLRTDRYDVLILGGGINGAVAAAALAARGVKVALIDRADFAGATSSNSSNLAWGGIKYLESHDYALVNKLCKSRNRLMDAFPSTVREVRFLATVRRGFRYPALFIFLGSMLYWLMGRFHMQAPHLLSRAGVKARERVINTVQSSGGVEYSDCYLHDNDARFVFNFVRSALNYGCIAVNYVESVGASREGKRWRTQVRDKLTGEGFEISSSVLINACGPWVDEHNDMTGQCSRHRHQYSKGIHLIVNRITVTERVLTFFASDGRLFFVIPMGPRSCIGTTDIWVEKPEQVVTASDRQFVLANVNRFLHLPSDLTLDDIIAERCGVRPLALQGHQDKGDWLQASRKHVIETDGKRSHISIFGGKLTDCLNIGDEVVSLIRQLGVPVPFPDKRWYGEPDSSIREEFMHRAWLLGLDSMTPSSSSELLSQRLWRRYGRNAIHMLESIRQDPREAELLIENAEYLRCEIRHAAEREMVTKLDDFLRRRSKIAQVVSKADIIKAPGLRDACVLLFGDQAQIKMQEYMDNLSG